MESSHTKWTSASSSILFIGSLLQHCRKNLEVLQTRRHSYTDELKEFIKDMKEQTKEISTELEKEGPRDHRWLIRRGSETGLIPRSIPKAIKVIKVTDLVASMLVFLFMSQWLQVKSKKKSSCLFSEWKGRGLPDATLRFYLASFFYFISFDFRFPKWSFEENQRYYRKWQYAQRRFNRMETFFYFAGFRWRILWSMSMPVPEGGQTVPLPDLWRGVPQRVCPGHYRCTPIPRIHHRTSQHQNRLELSGLCQLYTHVVYLSIAFVYVFSPVYTVSKPSFLFKIDNQ